MKTKEILQKVFIALSLIAVFALTGCAGGGGGGDGDGGDGGDGQPPSAPAGVSATQGNGQATVSWNTVSGATSYNIYMASVTGVSKGNYSALQDGMKHAGVTNPYTHTALTNGTTYYFVVTAVNAAGESAESDEVEATPQAGLTTSVSLPETGQTKCYDELGIETSCTNTGQDGDLKKGVAWPSPRFTPGTGTEADCITDNLTGLMLVKAPGATQRTWQDALTYSNDLNLCGFDDWRLPNINEIESLYNAGEPSSADHDNANWLIDQGFSDVPDDYYWSSTSYAFNTNYAWSVVMWNGDVWAFFPKSTSSSSYAWPVRSAQAGTIQLPKTGQTASYATGDDGDQQKGVAWPGTRFSVTDNCVTDGLTGLTWVKAPGTLKPWKDALEYANGLSLCGFSDWRLPNRKELGSLINYGYGVGSLAGWLNSQGFTNVQGEGLIPYWSSTSYSSNPDLAWYVDMADGRVTEDDKYKNGYVWPVRGGQ